MRENSAQGDRDHPLILMKQPFMRIDRHVGETPNEGETGSRHLHLVK